MTGLLKSDVVAAALRRQITAGKYRPGQRLPTRGQLGRRFDAGMAAVQRAVDHLRHDGLLHARPGQGTFVAPHLPHLRNIALVFPDSTSRFYLALRHAAAPLAAHHELRFEIYYTSNNTLLRADNRRLCDDVAAHRVGGVIFTCNPFYLMNSAALIEPGMPRVAVQFEPALGVCSVYPDVEGFVDRALHQLMSRRRRRIAHLMAAAPHYDVSQLEHSLRQRGVETRSYWIQAASPTDDFRAASRVVELMMQLEGERRPDALIIHDDNLIEHAVAGLLAAGVKIPGELEIVAHCNFPSPVPSVLPMVRIGFDCGQILGECLRSIEAQRAGRKSPAGVVSVPALFESELPASGATALAAQ